jgi:hypothetical protein
MKKRLKEIEEEASALREMQAKVEKEMGAVQGFILIITLFSQILQFFILSLFQICLSFGLIIVFLSFLIFLIVRSCWVFCNSS